MGIENTIANFGKNAGEGITTGLARAENRRRYNEESARQNQIAGLGQQKYAQEQMQAQEDAEREHVKGGVEAMMGAPPEQRGRVYQGWLQDAQKRGFDVEGAPAEYSDDALSTMAGAAGVSFSDNAGGKSGQKTNLGKLIFERSRLQEGDPTRDAYDQAISKASGMGDGGGNGPATVQEWQYYNQLPKEDQARFLNMKRANQTLNLGDRIINRGAGGDETVYTKGVSPDQAPELKGLQSTATEEAKLGAQLKIKPQIQEAVKLAEAAATARGETITELGRLEAAMPGLEETVGQLKELGSVATSTYGGRFFDAAAKELGYGATDGATARAKYVAIINNQVLPLLRDTFGAAFTAQEGESLKATMGDVNATPEAKVAVLEAFIAQKYRNIKEKQKFVDKDDSERSDIADLVNKYGD